MAKDDPGRGRVPAEERVWRLGYACHPTTWIGDPEKDGELDAKGALGELRSAALARLGLTLPDDATNARMRAIAARYVLANEFRSDLGGQGNMVRRRLCIKNIPEPSTSDQQKAVREVAKRLRERYPAAYALLADGIESRIGLVGPDS